MAPKGTPEHPPVHTDPGVSMNDTNADQQHRSPGGEDCGYGAEGSATRPPPGNSYPEVRISDDTPAEQKQRKTPQNAP